MTIDLEPFSERDIADLIGWVPSAAFLLQWAGPEFRFPLDPPQLQALLAEAQGVEPRTLLYKAVLRPARDPRSAAEDHPSRGSVGHGEILRIDREQRSAVLGRILVGPPELRGRGVGGQIIRGLLEIAFGDLGLHRVMLHVFESNPGAIRCYERSGFRHEGLLRHARRQGDRYENVCLMAILEEEWQEGSGA